VHLTPQVISYAIAGVIILVVMFFRLRGVAQTRRLRLPMLAIAPIYLVAVTGALLWFFRPAGMDWAWMAAALVLGGVLGWYRAKMMHIAVDPATQTLTMKMSPWALIFLIALIAIRYALRFEIMQNAAAWHVSVNLATDGLVVFALGLLGVQSLEMFIRGRRLLTEAKAGGAIAA
jgi:hypothetical protein